MLQLRSPGLTGLFWTIAHYLSNKVHVHVFGNILDPKQVVTCVVPRAHLNYPTMATGEARDRVLMSPPSLLSWSILPLFGEQHSLLGA